MFSRPADPEDERTEDDLSKWKHKYKSYIPVCIRDAIHPDKYELKPLI